jgi:hypothetical protein
MAAAEIFLPKIIIPLFVCCMFSVSRADMIIRNFVLAAVFPAFAKLTINSLPANYRQWNGTGVAVFLTRFNSKA